jgi:hypothetical protein
MSERRLLRIHEGYHREEIHDIFEPDTPFVPQRGRWGVWGLIELRDRPGDYVFLVTFGQRQGAHDFDEGVSVEGLLRWQSQPKQGLADPHIRRLIAHDAERNTIHLFLRTTDRGAVGPVPYTYLGRLAYDGHDRDRERPVHFRWRLIDWPIQEAVRARMGLRLDEEAAGLAAEVSGALAVPRPGWLLEEPPPIGANERVGESTSQFRAPRRRPSESVLQEIGRGGELLVLERERVALRAVGRADLAERVVHTAEVEGDHAGYDIRSFFPDGREKYIEVKTTTGPKDTPFFISAGEVAFSKGHPDAYELCRVFCYDDRAGGGRCFSVFGDVNVRFRLTATEFRAEGPR